MRTQIVSTLRRSAAVQCKAPTWAVKDRADSFLASSDKRIRLCDSGLFSSKLSNLLRTQPNCNDRTQSYLHRLPGPPCTVLGSLFKTQHQCAWGPPSPYAMSNIRFNLLIQVRKHGSWILTPSALGTPPFIKPGQLEMVNIY
jgi:hypothetical protein